MYLAIFRSTRRYALALMLLLAASANCLCATYDADGDDDVPPVNVEFKFVAPSCQARAQRAATVAEWARPAVSSISVRTVGVAAGKLVAKPTLSPQSQPPLRR